MTLLNWDLLSQQECQLGSKEQLLRTYRGADRGRPSAKLETEYNENIIEQQSKFGGISLRPRNSFHVVLHVKPLCFSQAEHMSIAMDVS